MTTATHRRASIDADVAVVGAGPAGAAAAIILARANRRVVLIDKATFPRDKCCGDGLTAAALRRLQDLGFDPASVPSWESDDEVVVVTPDGGRLRLPLPSNSGQFVAAARRADLDLALVELAAAAGAEVIEGHAVVEAGEAAGGRAVSLHLDDGRQVRSHFAIAADGMWSPVRKALGLGQPGYLGDWQAGRQYFKSVGPQARSLWVWFEPDMVPGYAWSFPLPGNAANVGYGVVRGAGQPAGPGELKGQRIDLLARPHIADVLGPDATPDGPWRSWPIPAGIGANPLSGLGGRVLFAGDAARACDPMTGEGIAQALETAELAARAIMSAGPHRPGAAAARYQRQIKWGLAVDDRLARTLSGVLAHRRGSIGAMRLVETTTWSRRVFARWMFEDYPRAILATPHRWHRHLFQRPGAFVAG
jgi:geranylgeranyl reductase family protein